MKTGRKASLYISFALTLIFAVALIIGVFFMASFVDAVSSVNGGETISESDKIVILCIAYSTLAFAFVADTVLFAILFRVNRGLIFTRESVLLVGIISILAVILGFMFILLGRFFLVSYGVGFAALFVGVCLGVVREVIRQATDIKSENDLTV